MPPVIYHQFCKADNMYGKKGSYQGSGTPFRDDQYIGCTTTPPPEYDSEADPPELPFWLGAWDGQEPAWEIHAPDWGGPE